MMNNPECIYIWVNPEQKVIAICACENNSKDALKDPFMVLSSSHWPILELIKPIVNTIFLYVVKKKTP